MALSTVGSLDEQYSASTVLVNDESAPAVEPKQSQSSSPMRTDAAASEPVASPTPTPEADTKQTADGDTQAEQQIDTEHVRAGEEPAAAGEPTEAAVSTDEKKEIPAAGHEKPTETEEHIQPAPENTPADASTDAESTSKPMEVDAEAKEQDGEDSEVGSSDDEAILQVHN